MSLETAEEIQQYLVLQTKSNEDLRSLCEGMELSSTGTRDELIQKLLSLSIAPQTDVFAPQLIALRTRFQGKEIKGAEAFIQRMRSVIFEGKGNTQAFSILNGKNQPYQYKMRFAKVSDETLKYLLSSELIYPHQSQRELVLAIKKEPTKFTFHIVNRIYGKNKSFIMLHVQSRT